MFIQIIEGRVTDPGRVHDAFDQWAEGLAPGAAGWLGTTAGVTDDGEFVAMARFESPEAAQRNSDRPEQDRWWAATSSLFAGDVTFHNCPQVTTYRDADIRDAQFVQVIMGHTHDAPRMVALADRLEPVLARARPDVIGETMAMEPDGGFAQTVYFTDEPTAREGERRMQSGELKQLMDEEMSLVDDVSYLDLRDPWTYRPAR
jgi:hypothetical protein